MKTRPFLSHRRADAAAVVELKRVLALYGVGGWRDLDDLHLGELGQPTFERAINEVTGGLMWYGTKRVLGSQYVNTVELPPAIERKRREADYPLVPLFVTVTPEEAAAALGTPGALSGDDHKTFFGLHGEVRGRARIEVFRRNVARQYLRSAVQWLAQEDYSVAVTALAEPAGTQDFTASGSGMSRSPSTGAPGSTPRPGSSRPERSASTRVSSANLPRHREAHRA